MRGRKLAAGERAERRAVVGPLFAYMTGHGIIALFVARRAGMRLGITVDKGRLSHIKRGRCLLPPGFIEAACREMGRSVEDVMGAEWVRRYGADVLVDAGARPGCAPASGSGADGHGRSAGDGRDVRADVA